MRKAVLVVLVLGLVVSLTPLAIFLTYNAVQRSQPPLMETIKSKYVSNIHSHYVKLSEREYLIVEPLSWAEHTWATIERYGNFIYTFPSELYGIDPEYLEDLISTVLLGESWCKFLQEDYKLFINTSSRYRFLLSDNCYWLKKLATSEEKSWYASLTLIEHFKKEFMREARLSQCCYWVWFIAYLRSDGLYVKFYNPADLDENKMMVEDIRKIVSENPILYVKLADGLLVTWREKAEELEEKNIPFLLIHSSTMNLYPSNTENLDPRVISSYVADTVKNVRLWIAEAVEWRLAYLDLLVDVYDAMGILMKNGTISVVYDWCDPYYEKYEIQCVSPKTPLQT